MPSSVKSGASIRRRRKNRRQEPALAIADEGAWALLDKVGISSDVGFMMRMAQLALVERIFSLRNGLDLALSQMTILQIIYARPASTQQHIADAMRINKTNFTPLINELAAKGLVSRRRSALNRKARALYLTRKGERSLRKVKEIA